MELESLIDKIIKDWKFTEYKSLNTKMKMQITKFNKNKPTEFCQYGCDNHFDLWGKYGYFDYSFDKDFIDSNLNYPSSDNEYYEEGYIEWGAVQQGEGVWKGTYYSSSNKIYKKIVWNYDKKEWEKISYSPVRYFKNEISAYNYKKYNYIIQDNDLPYTTDPSILGFRYTLHRPANDYSNM